MNEELLQKIYSKYGADKGTYEQFRSDMQLPEVRRKVYDKYLTGKGSYEQFESDLGVVGQNVQADVQPQPEPEREDGGFYNLIGKIPIIGGAIQKGVDAISRGLNQGASLSEGVNALTEGKGLDDEEVQAVSQILQKNKADAEGDNSITAKFMRGESLSIGEWVGLGTEVVVQSGAMMIRGAFDAFTNAKSAGMLGGGTAAGAAAGSPLFGIGTIAGGVAGTMGTVSGLTEAAGMYFQELQQELDARGLAINSENVRTIISDEEWLSETRKRASVKGIVVGGVDAITGGLAAKIGGKIVPKLAKSGLEGRAARKLITKEVGKGLGVEIAGGVGGEMGSQAALGEELDWKSGALEGLGEILPGGISIYSGYLGAEGGKQIADAKKARTEADKTGTPITSEVKTNSERTSGIGHLIDAYKSNDLESAKVALADLATVHTPEEFSGMMAVMSKVEGISAEDVQAITTKFEETHAVAQKFNTPELQQDPERLSRAVKTRLDANQVDTAIAQTEEQKSNADPVLHPKYDEQLTALNNKKTELEETLSAVVDAPKPEVSDDPAFYKTRLDELETVKATVRNESTAKTGELLDLGAVLQERISSAISETYDDSSTPVAPSQKVLYDGVEFEVTKVNNDGSFDLSTRDGRFVKSAEKTDTEWQGFVGQPETASTTKKEKKPSAISSLEKKLAAIKGSPIAQIESIGTLINSSSIPDFIYQKIGDGDISAGKALVQKAKDVHAEVKAFQTRLAGGKFFSDIDRQIAETRSRIETLDKQAIRQNPVTVETPTSTTDSAEGDVKSNWNYEGEGDAFASNKESRDGKSAYTIRILDRKGRGTSYNRAKQRGELDTESSLTYEGDKESVSAIDGNGNTVGVIELQTDGGVEHIVVAPEFSRKGVASELIKQIEQKGAIVRPEKSKQISPDAARLFNKLQSIKEQPATKQTTTTNERVSDGVNDGASEGVNTSPPANLAETEIISPEDTLPKETTKKLNDLAEEVTMKAQTAADLYLINRRIWGLNHEQAIETAVIQDRLVSSMAKRVGISKPEMYSRLDFKRNVLPPNTALYQIVGESAKMSRGMVTNLGLAQRAEKAGRPTSFLWRAFGWTRGVDGFWKAELPDGDITITSEQLADLPKNSQGDSVTTLGEIYNGEELLNAYPQLRDLQVTFSKSIPTANAMYNDEGIHLSYNQVAWQERFPRLSPSLRSVLVHEIQHAIQDIEGFAQGGSEDTINNVEDGSQLAGLSANQVYNNLAGETEARNVQTRLNLSPEERRDVSIVDTADVRPEDQIVLFQRDPEGVARGAMAIQSDGIAVMYALTNPNVSTPVHELIHVFERYLTDTERTTVLQEAGHNEWTTDTSEFFARGFERYLLDGVSPANSDLQSTFEKFKKWLTDIYLGLKNSVIDTPISVRMENLYASFLSDEDFNNAVNQPQSVLNHRQIEDLRSLLDQEELKKTGIPVEASIKDAIQNHISRPEDNHAKEIALALDAMNGMPLDASRQLAIAHAIDQLQKARSVAQQQLKLAQAKKWGLGSDVGSLRNVVDSIEDDIDVLTRGLYRAGSTLGRALAVRKSILEFSKWEPAAVEEKLKDTLKDIKTAREFEKGVINDQDRQTIRTLTDKVKRIRAEIDELVIKDDSSAATAKRMVAQQEVKKPRGKSISSKISTSRSLKAAKAQLDNVLAGKIC